MYIQLTERCNMLCDHCCFACTSKGRDMDFEVFQKALFTAFDVYEEWVHITLGGGEPTLWKHFKQMIDWFNMNVPLFDDIESLSMITNGTRKGNTFKFIKFKKYMDDVYDDTGKIVIMLSAKDGYHEDHKIHPDVYEYFYSNAETGWSSGVSFRAVNKIVRSGRAKSFGTLDFCACPEIFVKPDGLIKHCGCLDAPVIGSVFDPILDYSDFPCYKEKNA